jgi:hypothetical protein
MEAQMPLELVWIATLLVPILIFVVGNKFSSQKLVALRALVAILVGWGSMYLYRVFASSIAKNNVPATGALQNYYISDGAPNAFVVLFGWIVPAVLVLGAWLLLRMLKRFKKV